MPRRLLAAEIMKKRQAEARQKREDESFVPVPPSSSPEETSEITFKGVPIVFEPSLGDDDLILIAADGEVVSLEDAARAPLLLDDDKEAPVVESVNPEAAGIEGDFQEPTEPRYGIDYWLKRPDDPEAPAVESVNLDDFVQEKPQSIKMELDDAPEEEKEAELPEVHEGGAQGSRSATYDRDGEGSVRGSGDSSPDAS